MCFNKTNALANKVLRYRSIVSDIFDGELVSTVKCLTCQQLSDTKETFQVNYPISYGESRLVVGHILEHSDGRAARDDARGSTRNGEVTSITEFVRYG